MGLADVGDRGNGFGFHSSVHLSICLSVCMSSRSPSLRVGACVCSACLSSRTSIYLTVDSAGLSSRPSIYLTVWTRPVCPAVHLLYVCQAVRLPISLSICLPVVASTTVYLSCGAGAVAACVTICWHGRAAWVTKGRREFSVYVLSRSAILL
jgi:hypothetical protein